MASHILKIDYQEFLSYHHCLDQLGDVNRPVSRDFYRSVCMKLIVDYLNNSSIENGSPIERYLGRNYQVVQSRSSYCLHLPFSDSELRSIEHYLSRLCAITPELRLYYLFKAAVKFHGLLPIPAHVSMPVIEEGGLRAEFQADYAAYMVTAVKDAQLDVFMRCPPSPLFS